jgi:RNA polymerase sigma factor (sigma-70 family)
MSKLNDLEIVDAVKKMRDGTKSESRKAFLDMSETFQPLIRSTFNKVKSLVHSKEDSDQVMQFISSTFYEILVTSNFDMNDPIHIKSTLRMVLDGRINKDSVANELGISPLVHDLRRIENDFRIGVAKFHKEYGRLPDLSTDSDIALFAKITERSEEDVKEMSRNIGNRIDSIYKNVGDTDKGDDQKMLIDVLSSDERLPDELFEKKMFVRTLENVMQRVLSPDERRVFMLYYHPDNWHADDKTKEEIAAELGIGFSKVRFLLEKGKSKLRNVNVIKELRNACRAEEFAKIAASLLSKNLKTGSNTDEIIISSVIYG